jgi:PhnB protein
MTDKFTDQPGGTAPAPAPAGYRSLATFFAVPDAAGALSFYQDVFGAEVVTRFEGPGGVVMHAEVRLGDSMFQLGEPMPDHGLVAPPETGNAFTMTFWTPDVDELFERAVKAGATVMSPVDDAFSGDRMGVVRDPYGVRWCLARHDRDVPDAEIEAAARAWIDSQES